MIYINQSSFYSVIGRNIVFVNYREIYYNGFVKNEGEWDGSESKRSNSAASRNTS